MATTNKEWYVEIGPDKVDGRVYLAAHLMLEHVKSELQLDDITIRWIKKDDPTFAKLEKLLAEIMRTKPQVFDSEPLSGFTKSFHHNAIWIRADISPKEAAKTVAHEARHLWQLKHYRLPITEEEREAAEKDAMEYEEKAYKAVFGR